jgi:acetylornithine deacetylase/succinyl-diaminopimelate desuccinylase-like protein
MREEGTLDPVLERIVDRLMDEAVHLLSRLCRQPSVSAQGVGIREMANLLAGVMDELGIRVEVHETAGNPIVVGYARGRSELPSRGVEFRIRRRPPG